MLEWNLNKKEKNIQVRVGSQLEKEEDTGQSDLSNRKRRSMI
jgi:hypothetical protein